MRKFLALVLALFIAIPMLIGSLVLISIKPWVLNRDFYKKSLADDRLYSAVDSLMALDDSSAMTVDGVRLDSGAFRFALMKALPRADIQKFSAQMVDSAFDSLESKTPGKQSAVDLRPLQASLRKNASVFAAAYADKAPQGESAAFDPTDLSSIPKGMAKAKFQAALTPLVQKELDTKTEGTASSVTFPDFSKTLAQTPFKGNALKAFSSFMYMTLAFAALAWFVVGMLWPKPWSGRLPFMGGTLIVSSIAILLIGIAGTLTLNAQSVMSALSLFNMPAVAHGADLAIFKGYFASLAASMTRGFFITGIIAASIGAGLVSMRWVAAAREI